MNASVDESNQGPVKAVWILSLVVSSFIYFVIMPVLYGTVALVVAAGVAASPV